MDSYLTQLFETQINAVLNDDGQVVIEEVPFSLVEILATDPTGYTDAFTRWKDNYHTELLRTADEILSQRDNLAHFNSLLQAHRNEIVIPFIGAGMSKPSGFLLWSELLEWMWESANVPDRDFDVAIQGGDYETAAQLIIEDRGDFWLWDKIFHLYQSFDNNEVMGAVNYLPQIFKHGVVSTNYDNCIDKVYTTQDQGFGRICNRINNSDLAISLRNRESFLYQMHGRFDDATSRIFTKGEYDYSYLDPTFCEILRILFSERIVLFLGCSLANDRVMQFLHELVALNPQIGPHYAFLPEPSNARNRRLKERDLSERRISPIWYNGDHDKSLCALFEKVM